MHIYLPIQKDNFFTRESNIMDRGIVFKQEASILRKNVLVMDWFLTNCCFSFHKTVTDDWTVVDYCDVFISCLDSFWRHPFTAEDPLMSKRCDTTFLQIKFSSKLNFLGKLFLQLSVLKCEEAMFTTWHDHVLTCLVNTVQRSGHSGVCSCPIRWRHRRRVW